jgi:hypothetical protein
MLSIVKRSEEGEKVLLLNRETRHFQQSLAEVDGRNGCS